METTNKKYLEKRLTVGLTLRLIVVVSILLMLTGCRQTPEPVIPPDKPEPDYCPPPVKNMHGEWKAPSPYQAYQRASLNRDYLILKYDFKAYLLNLKTGGQRYLDIQSLLPDNVILSSAGYFYWCPYDNNRVLIHAVTGTDTTGDGITRYYYGQNLYIVTIDPFSVERVTPSIFGPAGGSFYITSWLPGSVPARDLIQLSNEIYIPQTDEFISTDIDLLMAISQDGKYYFSMIGRNAEAKTVWVINGNEFVFNDEMGLNYSSFSPGGKYLALSVSPPSASWEERRFDEIWIVNIEKFLSKKPDIVTPDKIINLRNDFCMYAMVANPCAEFISETTLAVAMYADGDDKSYLWKVGIDGKLLGQLTFEP